MKIIAFLALLCVACVAPPAVPKTTWYSATRGGVAMPWEIKIWDYTKATLKRTLTDVDSAGIIGGFKWSVAPDGNCIQFAFQGRGSLLPIAPRDIVQLSVDGVPQWYGFISRLANPRDPDGGSYTALGMRELFKRDTTGRYRLSPVADLAELITRTATGPLDYNGYRYALPVGVAYNAAKVQTALGSIQKWDYAYVHLEKALNELAGSAATATKITWGVDALGEFFFREPSGALNVPFDSTRVEYMPVDAEDVIGAIRFPLSLENPAITHTQLPPAGTFLTTNPFVPGTTDHIGNPIEYSYANSPNYGVSEFGTLGRVVPFKLFSTGYDSSVDTNLNNPTNAYDGDPNTFASSTLSIGNCGLVHRIVPAVLGNTVGVEFEYSTAPAGPAFLLLVADYTYFNGSSRVSALRQDISLPGTKNHAVRNRIRLVIKYDGADSVDRLEFTVQAYSDVADNFRIYDLRRFEIDTVTLQALAKSQLKLPAVVVSEIKLSSLAAAVKTVTVTGVPGGDLSGDTAQFSYSHEADGLRQTTINLGNTNQSEESRIIRVIASDLDRSDRDELRAYADRRR